MVGHAKSQALKRQILRKEVDDLKEYAVNSHQGRRKSHCARSAKTHPMHTSKRQADVFHLHTKHWPAMEKVA